MKNEKFKNFHQTFLWSVENKNPVAFYHGGENIIN